VIPAATSTAPAGGTAGSRAKVPVKPPITGEYQLILFEAAKRERYLTSSSRPLPYKLTYTLSLPADSFKFEFSLPEVSGRPYFIENNRERDTMNVWLTDSTVYNRPQLESIVRFPFTDSLGAVSIKTDTILMRYVAPRAPRARIAKRVPYNVNTGHLTGSIRPDIKITFTAPTPFSRIDTSRIKFYEISKEQRINIPYTLRKDSAVSWRYHVDTNLNPGHNYLFIADSAAFTGIYGDFSDSTGTRFTVMSPDLFGKLTLNITNSDSPVIIQLLENSEKMKRERYMEEDGKIEFPLLEKGVYRVRAIYDLDGDRKWTTGEFEIHRQPEPVSYYPTEIEVKENWQVEQTWDLEKRNFKDFKLQKVKTTGP